MKAVVFDLDNTLFDHTGSAERALRAWVAGLGIAPADELVAEWFAIEDRVYDAYLRRELTHQGQRRERLRAFLPLLGREVPSADAELDEVFEGYLAQYRSHWIAYPDARPALEVARGNGWRVGVLTNGNTVQQKQNSPQSGSRNTSTSCAHPNHSASASPIRWPTNVSVKSSALSRVRR